VPKYVHQDEITSLQFFHIPHTTCNHLMFHVSCFKPFQQHFQEDKIVMTLKKLYWRNGEMLKSTMAKMATNALRKALNL